MGKEALLREELLKRFADTGRQEDIPDPIVICKFFNPCGSQTWLATEYSPDERMFFGYVSLFNTQHENELGYFPLDELESIKIKPFGLGIERDLYFEPAALSEVKRRERIC